MRPARRSGHAQHEVAVVLALLVAAPLGACDRKRVETPPRTGPSSVGTTRASTEARGSAGAATDATGAGRWMPSNAQPAEPCIFSGFLGSLLTARCQREVRCGHVGPNKTYNSFLVCCHYASDAWNDITGDNRCLRFDPESNKKCLEDMVKMNCDPSFDDFRLPRSCLFRVCTH